MRFIREILSVTGLVLLGACANAPSNHPAGEAYDPYEKRNRAVHEFNKGVDRNAYRPAGTSYSDFVPDDIENGISRFAFNLSLPRHIVNNALQGNMRSATENTYRFLVNSTIGLGGFFDTASELNMPEADTSNFGETLHVWGVREGAYVELPFLGPSTERDTVGMVVDLFTNPLSYLLDTPENYYATFAGVASSLSNRGRYKETIDSILYESADSYAQSRSLYIQNRRFELGDDEGGAYLDPYDDPYGPISEDLSDE